MNNGWRCVCFFICSRLQQFERGVQAAEFWALRAVEAECAGQWCHEAGAGWPAEEARDHRPNAPTGDISSVINQSINLFLSIVFCFYSPKLFFPFTSAQASRIPTVQTSRSSYCWRKSSSWRHTITRLVQREPCEVIAHCTAVAWNVRNDCLPSIFFCFLVVGVDWSAAGWEELLRRADSGRRSCMEGQDRATVNAGKPWSLLVFFQINKNVEIWRYTDRSMLPSDPVQVSLVAEERDQNISRVQELEAAVAELKNTAGQRLGATSCFNRMTLGKMQSHLIVFPIAKVAFFPTPQHCCLGRKRLRAPWRLHLLGHQSVSWPCRRHSAHCNRKRTISIHSTRHR